MDYNGITILAGVLFGIGGSIGLSFAFKGSSRLVFLAACCIGWTAAAVASWIVYAVLGDIHLETMLEYKNTLAVLTHVEQHGVIRQGYINILTSMEDYLTIVGSVAIFTTLNTLSVTIGTCGGLGLARCVAAFNNS